MEWEYQIFDEQGRAFEMADARNCSMVVTSPGFYPQHPGTNLQKRKERKFLVSLSLEHYFGRAEGCSHSGTNGKTSVTTLMHHVCQARGIKSVIAEM